MNNDIFRTVYSSAYNMAQRQLAKQEQRRREEQQRRDQLNVQTNQALLGTLQEIGKMQDRDFQRRQATAQAAGRTAGKALKTGAPGVDPGMVLASQLGTVQHQTALQDLAVKRAFEVMQQERNAAAALAAAVMLRGLKRPSRNGFITFRTRWLNAKRISSTRTWPVRS